MALEWCNGFNGDMGLVLGLHGSGFQGTTLTKSCNNTPMECKDHRGSKKSSMIVSSILAELLLLVPSEDIVDNASETLMTWKKNVND